MSNEAYDKAQTNALALRDARIDSILWAVSEIRKNPGSLDTVSDLLSDIVKDATVANEINNDISCNRLFPYRDGGSKTRA